MKTADPPEALLPLSGQIHLSSQNQSRPALGLGRIIHECSRWLCSQEDLRGRPQAVTA
jgi:hypothetical protein